MMKALKLNAVDSAELDLNAIAFRFKLVSQEIESLTRIQKSYRATLEAAATAHGNVIETEDFKIQVIPAAREVLSLKEMRLELNSKVMAVVSRFIRLSKYNQVRVSAKGKAVA